MRRSRRALYILPNLFTLSSVFCGLLAIHWSTHGGEANSFYRAAFAILFAAIFDMLDGRVARLTRTDSEIGVQLDSLADVISFGVAPAFLLYNWGLGEIWLGHLDVGFALCFLYVAAGAFRLARFNALAMTEAREDTEREPSPFFVGLPIPVAACMLAALVFAHHQTAAALFQKRALLMVVVPLLGWLMISNVPYRNFKHAHLSRRSFVAVLAAVGLAVLVALKSTPGVLLMGLLSGYVLLGLFEHALGFPGRVSRRRAIRRARRAQGDGFEIFDDDDEPQG